MRSRACVEIRSQITNLFANLQSINTKTFGVFSWRLSTFAGKYGTGGVCLLCTWTADAESRMLISGKIDNEGSRNGGQVVWRRLKNVDRSFYNDRTTDFVNIELFFVRFRVFEIEFFGFVELSNDDVN